MSKSKLKWLIAAPLFAVIATAVLFWGRALDRAEKPAPAQTASTQAPAGSEHELAALREQLKKKPGHAPILFRMAEIERERGRPAEAAAHLRELLTHEPDNAEARLEIGRALFEAGDVAGALEQTRRLVDQQPGNVDALYNLGAIYGNLNDADQARKYWTAAVRAAPDSESGKRAGDMLARLGSPRN